MANTAQSGSAISPFHKYPFIIGNTRIPLFFKFTQNPNNIKISMEKEYQETRTIGGYVFEHWGKKPTIMTGKVTIKKDSELSNLIGLNTSQTNLGIEDAAFNPELSTFQTLFNIDQRKLATVTLGGRDAFEGSKVVSYTVAGAAALQNPYTLVSAGFGGVMSLLGKKDYKFREPDPASIQGYIDTLTDTIILYKGVIYSGFFTKFDYVEDGVKPFTNEVNFTFLVTNTTADWLDTQLTQTATGRALAGLWGATTSVATIGSLLEDVFKNTGSNTNGHI